MNPWLAKLPFFGLEGLNAFATTYYFYYLFFHLRHEFGFGSVGNLSACALHGLVYGCSAWFGGAFAQRTGYFVSLRLGFGIMGGALVAGYFLEGVLGQMILMAVWTFGMSFTWPTLEALVSEGEPPQRLQTVIGIYNMVWAGGSALAYFVGGALLEQLGSKSLFWLPAVLHATQLTVVFVLAGTQHGRPVARPAPAGGAVAHPASHPEGKQFLRMAWLANPFAYVAINAALPVIPVLADRLALSRAEAGFFCSIWLFARFATFIWLWRWPGWHYHFGWLAAAYVLLMASFAVMLLVPVLSVMAAAQMVFGFAVGLIYYSSLFYSMDVGETKGEHGGIHEAAIGIGVFGGAAIGAASQAMLQRPSSSTWGVMALLLLGFAGLGMIRRKPRALD